LLKKIVSGLMVIMLLESVMCIATVFPNTIAAASSSGSEDWWLAFRHDLSHTGHSTSEVPIILCPWWDTGDKINGSVRSSPAVVNNRVFIGSSNKRIYTLNATTGSIIPGRTFYAGGAVESSPTVADGKVFFGSMNGSVYALEVATGNRVWNFAAKDSVYSSPVVVGGVVYFGSLDGYVYALNAGDKTEKWRFWTASKIYSSPAVSGGRIFVGASDGRIYALNLTGRCEWFYDTGQNCSSSPSVANGRVFIGSDNGKLYAFNATKREYLWNYTTGGKVKSSPAVADGCVFFGSMDGKVYALNETTGKQVWNYTTGGFVYSSPAVADGRIFAGSGDNRTYVLNATNGHHICNFTTGGPVYSSPAVAQQMVFIGSDDKKVHAFGAENMWPQPKIHPNPEQPLILQKVVLNGSESTDPEGNIVNCTWDFGDDKPPIKNVTWQSGKIVSHTYQIAKNYTVTLTVTDDHPSGIRRTNSTSLLLRVQEAWPMYRHDWNHTGCSTSLAPPTNGTLWKTPVSIGPNASADTYMYSSPAVVGDMIYIASTNGTVFGIGATNGSKVWNMTLEHSFHSSPAMSGDRLFIGDDAGVIYAINTKDRTIPWSNDTGSPIYSSPTVADGIVFVASRSHLQAFDVDSGVAKWPQPFVPGGDTYSSPAV